MAPTLNGKTIAFLVAPEGIEQVELTEPWQAVQDAGGTPRLVSTDSGTVPGVPAPRQGGHVRRGRHRRRRSRAADYDGLVLPGGVANPDSLRMQPAAVAFAKSFFDAGKPVAAICHAPWTLVEADVVRGRRMTSWPSLKTDLRNAGADWVDEEVVVCENGPNVLVTSRKPDDLKAFCSEVVDRFADRASRVQQADPSVRAPPAAVGSGGAPRQDRLHPWSRQCRARRRSAALVDAGMDVARLNLSHGRLRRPRAGLPAGCARRPTRPGAASRCSSTCRARRSGSARSPPAR